MAMGWKIWIDCEKCHGDGLILDYATTDGIDPFDVVVAEGDNPVSKTCPKCKGTKKFPWGWLEEELTEIP